MDVYSQSIHTLIEELASLPGVGRKTATRLAFHILNMPQERVSKLAESINTAKKSVKYCKECCTLTDQDVCPICSSPKRNHKVIMVVEGTKEIGRAHV